MFHFSRAVLLGVVVLMLSMPALATSINVSFHDWQRNQSSISYAYDGGALNVSGLRAQNNETIGSWNVQSWGGVNGGLGVWNGSNSLSHGLSNQNLRYEMVLLDFGQAVSLNSFTVSYGTYAHNNWASVLAYTGSDVINSQSFSDLRWDQLVGNEFTTAGHPNSLQGVANHRAKQIDGGLVSQYWLIGVYNKAFAESQDVEALGTYLEGFKLSSVDFTAVSEVPLPAAAWLFLTGLAGMAWMKKRKAKQSSELQVA